MDDSDRRSLDKAWDRLRNTNISSAGKRIIVENGAKQLGIDIMSQDFKDYIEGKIAEDVGITIMRAMRATPPY